MISKAGMKKLLKNLIPFLMVFAMLVGCATDDRPFSLVDDANEPPPEGSDGSGSTPPGVEGCVVNFNGTVQIKISADAPGGDAIEKLDAQPLNLDPVPFLVDGNNMTLLGDTFPTFIMTTVSDSADLRISGIAGSSATGTYDPATGSVDIPGFKLSLEILNKGTTTNLVPGFDPIDNIDLTTGSVTANGNLNPINEEGSPLNSSDMSITLVAGVTLPNSFPTLSLLDDKIAGGALTATFEGAFDQLPENCTEGGGGTTPPGGAGGPEGLKISVNDAAVSEIDFGSTLVLVTSLDGQTILNCEDASNRGIVTQNVTLSNSGTGDRKIQLLKPIDTDNDEKDPLCSGSSEFVRGTIQTHGSATCNTVDVGGKDFVIDECTIPEGSENMLSFPLMYVPFNYVAPPVNGGGAGDGDGDGDGDTGEEPSGPTAVVDTGSLLIEYDDGKSFALPLKGVTEPDTSDSLSVSKVNDGTVSQKEIPSGGLLKIALDAPSSFDQNFVIKNASGDTWENVTVTLAEPAEGETSAFTVIPPTDTTVGPQADSDNPGTLGFGLTFNPEGGSQSFEDSLTITLNKSGSSAVVEMVYKVQGTVGIDPILGNYQLKIDFMTALINNSLQSQPVESLDFRDFTDQAPQAQIVTFNSLNEEEFNPVDLLPNIFDLLNSTVSERRQALRILNAQASGLVPGDDSTKCNEPSNINQAYPAGQDTGGGKQDCAYFYFDLTVDDGVQGLYDEETGNIIMPNVKLRIQNPYHDDVGGVWAPSNPSNSNTILDTEMELSLSTKVLDKKEDEVTGLSLVPDSRISRSKLNIDKSKKKDSLLGEDCVDPDPVASLEHPHFKCYLTADGKYLQGRPLALRQGETNIYDVILVGVGHFNPNTLSGEEGTPVFLSDSDMYLVIQARLCPEGVDCDFTP